MNDITSFRFGKMVIAAGIGLACWQLQAATYLGNGGTGFGGPLGTGSLTLSDNGTTVSGTFTRGGGNHNDTLVLYIDSIAGGLATTSGMDDQADDLRRAVSGVGGFGRSTVNFAPGFGADFAIALHNNSFTFGGEWQTINCSGPNCLPFVTSVNLSGGGSGAASYTFDFDLTEIGLTPNNGDSFNFVATYLAESGFRSDEAIGASNAGTFGGNLGAATLEFSGSESYTSVPEPASYLLLGLGALGMIFCLRRRA